MAGQLGVHQEALRTWVGRRKFDGGIRPGTTTEESRRIAELGKRLHILRVDEPAAAVVRRIFAEFLAGFGIYAIAERLTAEGIACPSAHDPDRNRHRCGIAWSKYAVRAILTNPRYTGRQVWNRQRKDEVLLDVHDVAQGHTTKMRWNDQDKWIYSEQAAHPLIIDEETFTRAQDLLTARRGTRGPHKPHKSRHAYALRGLLFCGVCERRMQGHWANHAPYYRCRFPAEYALANRLTHPLNVTLRQDALLGPLDEWLASKFDPCHLPATIDELAAAAVIDQPEPRTQEGEISTKIDECDHKLYQALKRATPQVSPSMSRLSGLRSESPPPSIGNSRVSEGGLELLPYGGHPGTSAVTGKRPDLAFRLAQRRLSIIRDHPDSCAPVSREVSRRAAVSTATTHQRRAAACARTLRRPLIAHPTQPEGQPDGIQPPVHPPGPGPRRSARA